MQGGVKWTVAITSILIIFIFLFWAVFYSTILSNNPQVILLRSWYQNTFVNTKRAFIPKDQKVASFDSIYTFQVQRWMDTNVYRFSGTFVKMDSTLNMIHLLGKDNVTYVFRLSNEFIKGQQDVTSPVSYFPNQDIINIKDDLPFTKNSKIDIFWDDGRTLKEILDDYSKTPLKPLNDDSNRYFFLTKSG
jgi:hypothetical protein